MGGVPVTQRQTPLLLFFTARTSGPARRMASLVAWIGVSQKKRLRVLEVDVDEEQALADRLAISEVPTLVLLDGSTVLDRLEGRVTGPEIERFLDRNLD